uniref:Adenylyl cyclase n=1 Tax=Ganoderma boninense TaxID=34458 RepID=A0A5K1K7A9_9APHY|nr:Adenylyl cyclase [Ganoderma boninense]
MCIQELIDTLTLEPLNPTFSIFNGILLVLSRNVEDQRSAIPVPMNKIAACKCSRLNACLFVILGDRWTYTSHSRVTRSTHPPTIPFTSADESSAITRFSHGASTFDSAKIDRQPEPHCRGAVQHTLDVVSAALQLMKFPLAVLLAILLTISLFVACLNLIVYILPLALPSFCDFPVASRLSVCAIGFPGLEHMSGNAAFDHADFPSLIKIQNVVLDDLATGSAGGKDMALNVKHAELAVKDLAVVVRSSNLSVKLPLGEALVEFSTDARTTSRSLQRLSARINGAVDSIISFNTHAFRAIDAVKQKSAAEASSTILRAFQMSMNAFSSQITSIMLDATAVMSNLDMLEMRLLTIHDLCIQESLTTAIELDDMLWELWTILGGNHSKLRDLRHRMTVLKEIQQYRAVAVAYVAATTQTVLLVDAQLSELRDRLVDATVDAEDIPVEVHLASIERSLLRVREERLDVQLPRIGQAS